MTDTWHVNREYEGIEISFDGKPSEEIRNKMKAVGFKWSSAQMKWYAKDNTRTRQVANELATQGEDVGEHLTFEQKMERDKDRAGRRQERLGAKAEKLESVAESKLEQAHKMADVIPFGQPILIGHHSEGRDRRYRERIHGTYEKGFEAMKEAKEVSQRLEGSQALSRKRETPGYMSRKIDKLETDLRKFERDKGQWQGHSAEWEKRTNDLKEQIAYWKKELGEAGGLKVTPADVKAGDEILYIGTWYEVVRVNPKTVTIKNWLDIPTWTWGAEYSKIKAVRHKSYEKPLELKPKIPDAEYEKAKLFLSSLATARTLDELIGWQPAVKRWSIKFPELEKELESEYQARFDYLKAAKETSEADRKEKASKPQSEQAKDLYKQMRKTNSVRELDDWRNRVLFEAHLTDVQEDILMRELAGNWRIYLESRGVPASEKLDKLGSDLPDDEYYFGTEVTIHPTTTIFDDSPIIGIIHTARNQGELFEVAWDSPNGSIISRVPIERLYVRKLVTKPEPRYQAPAKKIEDYKGVKYIVDKDNYVWVQESPYPKLDKHYTYLSEFKRHVDTLEKRKQDEITTATKVTGENIVTETFLTLREAEQRRFNLQYKGYLIKDEVVADTSEFGKPKYSISYIPEKKSAYEGFKEIKEKEKPKLNPDTSSKADIADLAEEIKANKGEIVNGKAILYHFTTPEAKKQIEETGMMYGKEDGIFFSTRPDGQAKGYGTAIIKVRVPLNQLELDDVFGDEAHLRIPTAKAGDRVRVEIVSPVKIDTSGKDYTSGYNLAIHGRIAPAVPAWSDQGQADFAAGYAEGKRIYEQSKPEIIFGQKPQESPVIFGTPISPVPSKPRYLCAPSRQEIVEKEARKRAEEGKKLRGQQVLTSAVSTSRRLSEFEEKPIIPQQPIKSMASEEQKKRLEIARAKTESLLAEEARLDRELKEMQRLLDE